MIAEAAAARQWDGLPQLVELGFNVNGRTASGRTAAHFAAGAGNLPVLRLLVAHGADLSSTDPEFEATPLGWAQWFKQPEAAAFLTQHQAAHNTSS